LSTHRCIIFVLFRFGFTRTIWAYMSLSGVSIFAFMGGSLALRLLQVLEIPLDAISFGIGIWNFAVVGILATFLLPLPLRLRQAYLIFVGVVTALWFSHLPELTTWALLILMAAYDVAAVLCPGGPLRALVELAQQRNQAIPALVYESRPMRRGLAVPPPDPPMDVAPPAGADSVVA
jgi:presenilin 1